MKLILFGNVLPVRRKRNNLLRHRGRSIFVILHCTESKESILFLCRQQTGAELLGFQQKVQVWCRLYCTGRQLGAWSWDCCHCRAPLAASACHVPGMGGSRRAQGQWCWVTCGQRKTTTEVRAQAPGPPSLISVLLSVPFLNIDALEF